MAGTELCDYRRWLREQQYAPRTAGEYVRCVRRALGYLTSIGVNLRSARPEHLFEWLSTLPPTASSRNQARKALLCYYKSIGRRPNPASDIEALPQARGLPRPLSPSQRKRLLATAPQLGGDIEVMARLFLTTGVRFSELLFAEWSAFELEEDGGFWRVTGKGANRSGPKQRDVPIRADLVPVLRAWRGQVGSVWLFPSPMNRSRTMSATTFRTRWRLLCEVAGVEGAVPHQTRHTVATIGAKADLQATQYLLGHDSLATTQIYTLVESERLRAVVEALPA